MSTCAETPDSSPAHSALQPLQGQGIRVSFLLFLSIQVNLHTCQAGEPLSQDRDNQTCGRGPGRRRKEQSMVRVSGREGAGCREDGAPFLPSPPRGEARPVVRLPGFMREQAFTYAGAFQRYEMGSHTWSSGWNPSMEHRDQNWPWHRQDTLLGLRVEGRALEAVKTQPL